MEDWLTGAYPIYKTREIDHLTDEEILGSSNELLIQKIMATHLSPIKLKNPIYFSFKNYDNISKTDIHIPYHGTMSTFSYCPNEFLSEPPILYAENYNIKNADAYDPSINWAGTSFTSHSSEHNVLMFLFDDNKLEEIQPTLDKLNQSIHVCNHVIQDFEKQEIPEIYKAIEKRRAQIVSKNALLTNLGLVNGSSQTKKEQIHSLSNSSPAEKYVQEKRRGGHERHRQTTEIKDELIKPMFANRAQSKITNKESLIPPDTLPRHLLKTLILSTKMVI